jgi:nucleotide-binding universal stress UspA family protein
MLARLQTTLGIPNLAEQILLIPNAADRASSTHPAGRTAISTEAINLLVGYSNSTNSQIALDLTLWIALQTRLATNQTVTVQVVYVAEEPEDPIPTPYRSNPFNRYHQDSGNTALLSSPVVAAQQAAQQRAAQFETADRILWQARSLAGEWRGSLKTHLRFGSLATELSTVARQEAANLLIVGCQSRDDRLIRQLRRTTPCPVLGIPIEP